MRMLLYSALAISGLIASCERRPGLLGSLPESSEILESYSSGGGGNGDGIYAAKIEMSEEIFGGYVKGMDILALLEYPKPDIGTMVSPSDVPASESWWSEPIESESRYYRKFDRSFIRITFDNGICYFYSRRW